MSAYATKLRGVVTATDVEAELHDDLPIETLFEAEEMWAPERVRFLRDCMRHGVSASDLPQSIHWSWSLKAMKIPGLTFGPLSEYRLFGIRAEDRWQGLAIAKCLGYRTRLAPLNRELVYVDFVESAPWNWSLPKANRQGQLRGVGKQLIELAIEWSRDLDFKGRVGLHALPQAESFYRDVCHMTDLGVDAKHQSLRYFEFTEEQANAYLGEQ